MASELGKRGSGADLHRSLVDDRVLLWCSSDEETLVPVGPAGLDPTRCVRILVDAARRSAAEVFTAVDDVWLPGMRFGGRAGGCMGERGGALTSVPPFRYRTGACALVAVATSALGTELAWPSAPVGLVRVSIRRYPRDASMSVSLVRRWWNASLRSQCQ
jgi:hypothetical protein